MEQSKIDQLKDLLEQANKLSAELLNSKPDGGSPHAGPLRSRVTAAQDSLEAHVNWRAENVKA